MGRPSLLRTAALALVVSGIPGLFVVAALVTVGMVVFQEIDRAREGLERERGGLVELPRQVDRLAATVDRATQLVAVRQQLLALQVAFYGTCLLFTFQALLGVAAGVALYRFAARRVPPSGPDPPQAV